MFLLLFISLLSFLWKVDILSRGSFIVVGDLRVCRERYMYGCIFGDTW